MTQRNVLPNRRYGETFELVHGEHRSTFQVTVGYFPGGAPAEVFIHGAKAGSSLEAVARDGAVLLSIAMQFGVPLEVMKHAITRETDGTASTVVGAVIDKLMEAAK